MSTTTTKPKRCSAGAAQGAIAEGGHSVPSRLAMKIDLSNPC